MSEWRNVHRPVKALHSVGRTVVRLRPCGVTAEQVDALREEHGGYGSKDWSHLALTQRIDLVATEILRKDRLARHEEAKEEIARRRRARQELPRYLYVGADINGVFSKTKSQMRVMSARMFSEIEYPYLSQYQAWLRAQRELPWPNDAVEYIQAMMRLQGRHSTFNVLDPAAGAMGLRRSSTWVGFRSDFIDRVEEMSRA